MSMDVGISGRIAKAFQNNPLTPVLAIVMVILGLIAMTITPKEEDPQIDVTMVDVFLSAPGWSATDIEKQIATKAEVALSQIVGVEHVFSVSSSDRAVITVQFEVGVKRQQALVKTWEQVMAELSWPESFGVSAPVVRARGINDVPIVSLTFYSKDTKVSQTQLGQVATSVGHVLQRIEGTRNIEISGYAVNAVNVKVDPIKAANYGIDIRSVAAALQSFSRVSPELSIPTNNQNISVSIGQYLQNERDVGNLIVLAKGNKLVRLRDFAEITLSSTKPSSYVQMGFAKKADTASLHTAVTLSIAKKEGENAIDVADKILATAESLKGQIIPTKIEYSITRNSGKTAQEKANKLIEKLLFATLAVVVLVLFALGKRAAIIVGIAVGLTLLITLFSSWAWGFTLNRISLFALIFSIGILVDDAIVVVENIHRRQQLEPDQPLTAIIPKAVDEVGSSTILATFTVIAALLPMAFVSGLMGPYMSPIPVNASSGMLLSLLIAFTVTPWLAVRLLKTESRRRNKARADITNTDLIGLWAANILAKFITHQRAINNQWKLFVAIVVLMVSVLLLPASGAVLLKMLPFDNKSTMAITVDMPEGTTVENTLATLQAISAVVAEQEYTVNYQLYAGTNAPITFNGLVRQYYMRTMAHQGEIALTILGNEQRAQGSHDIAKHLRQVITPVAKRYQAQIKIVEEPSGPPTLAPIVAEVYGPDHNARVETAKGLLTILNSTSEVVDTDIFLAAPQTKWQVVVDEQRARILGLNKLDIQTTLQQLLSEQPISYLHNQSGTTPTPIIISTTDAYKANIESWLHSKIVNRNGELVPLSQVVEVKSGRLEQPIYHKNLRPVIYLVADMAGNTDSPLYGMFQANDKFRQQFSDVASFYTQAPSSPYENAIKWDGEWQITYETFRDMGAAYAAGLLLIYLLILAQFKSYKLPLLIMAPIPLTVIGIFPGHWLLDAKFTAPSMIGMIALAGIIVRNSILLVDFIEQQLARGEDLKNAVIASAQMRARAIILTALAAMIGALFIVSDPIFKGLAVSLMFGMAVSSVLTLLVIPIAYYRSKKKVFYQ